MEDRSREHTINEIAHNILPGIDWKSPCPSREKWSWTRIWNWAISFDRKKIELQNKLEDENEIYQASLQSGTIEETKNMDIHEKRKKLSRCGYQYCDIKMQDPCGPCCCEVECIEPPPCTDIPRIDRTPKCDCDKRKKIRSGRKSCESCNMVLESA